MKLFHFGVWWQNTFVTNVFFRFPPKARSSTNSMTNHVRQKRFVFTSPPTRDFATNLTKSWILHKFEEFYSKDRFSDKFGKQTTISCFVPFSLKDRFCWRGENYFPSFSLWERFFPRQRTSVSFIEQFSKHISLLTNWIIILIKIIVLIEIIIILILSVVIAVIITVLCLT